MSTVKRLPGYPCCAELCGTIWIIWRLGGVGVGRTRAVGGGVPRLTSCRCTGRVRSTMDISNLSGKPMSSCVGV